MAVNLENDIKNFIENGVNYNLYKEKFSKLCNKLIIFYNTIIQSDMNVDMVISQIENAQDSLKRIIVEVKEQAFFDCNSRKREELLTYIVYCEYIIFKTYLRCGKIGNFNEYKANISECSTLFISEEYDRFTFNFLISDLEHLQIFITNNLQNDSMYSYILENCQKLQNDLDEYSKVFFDNKYFSNLMKFENTICNVSKMANIKLEFEIPKILVGKKKTEEIVSVNKIALAILKLIDSPKALLLHGIINNFTVEISWREFFFLCKIFELYNDLITVSESTIFSIVKDKFLKLAEKYKEYTQTYIRDQKTKILNYNGNKSKKYILLLTADEKNIIVIKGILESLFLDFVIKDNEVYLNNSYFNGFKNLEENFGAIKIF